MQNSKTISTKSKMKAKTLMIMNLEVINKIKKTNKPKRLPSKKT